MEAGDVTAKYPQEEAGDNGASPEGGTACGSIEKQFEVAQ